MTVFVRSDSLSEVAANTPRRLSNARQLVNAARVANTARGAAWALVLLLAVWFLMRRWYGAFSLPLAAQYLIPLAFLLVAISWCLTLPARVAAWWHLCVKTLPLLAVFALGFAVSLPGSARLTLGAFWAVIVLGTLPLPVWCYYRRNEESDVSEKSRIQAGNVGSDPQPALDRLGAGESLLHEACEANDGQSATFGLDDERPFLSDEVTQQITRARLADGSDVVHGVLRASFAAGERLASVHVGFCPPFQCRPRIEASWSKGPESTVKAAQVLPYGARFDIWLSSEPAVETNVLIEFHALA